MCENCGCQEALENDHEHSHDHSHAHDHPHTHEHKTIRVEQNIKALNDQWAQKNRTWLHERRIRTVNLISSPGAGKTMLIERTLEKLGERTKNVAVLTGDLQTDNDAARIGRVTDRVRQINTINSCHLDAEMIFHNLGRVISENDQTRLLMIENVGNLVCPAAFDLGEDDTVALLSVTEGEDKPVKYPVLFSKAKTILITKMDLAPHVDFQWQRCLDYIRRVNAKAPIIKVSAKTGEGMEEWISKLWG